MHRINICQFLHDPLSSVLLFCPYMHRIYQHASLFLWTCNLLIFCRKPFLVLSHLLANNTKVYLTYWVLNIFDNLHMRLIFGNNTRYFFIRNLFVSTCKTFHLRQHAIHFTSTCKLKILISCMMP